MESPFHRHFPDIFEKPLKHRRILGPPGSGKTSLLLERYHELRRSHTGSGEVIIITYSRESRERLAEQVVGRRRGGIGRLPVFTYHELAWETLSQTGRRAPRVIDELEELVLLDRIIRRREVRLRSDYERVGRSEKFQREVLAAINRLVQNQVGPAEADRMLSNGQDDGRSADILRLYRKYLEWLEQNRATTYYGLAWLAVEALRKQLPGQPKRETAAALIDDFQDVDPGQYALLRAVVPPESPTEVTVFGDPSGARFRYRGTDSRFLTECFPHDYGGETFSLPLCCAAGGGFSAVKEKLLRDTAGSRAENCLPAEQLDEPVQVRFANPAGEVEEALLIAAWAKDLLRKNIEPDRIAVAVRTKQLYEPILSAAFQMHGVPLETGRRGQGPGETLVYNLLRLLGREEETALEVASASPLVAALGDHWRGQLGLETTDGTASDFVLEMVAGLRERQSRLAPRDWMVQFIRWLFPLDYRWLGETADGESFGVFLSNLLSEWERFVGALEQIGSKAGPDRLIDFLSRSGLFSDLPRPVSPRPGRPGLYSIHELNGRHFAAVSLAGCSELIFPAPREGEGLIPYDELAERLARIFPDRKIELYETRTIETHLKDEFSLMLMALTRASRELLITAPSRFAGREETGPAAILSDLMVGELTVQVSPSSPEEPPVQTTPPAILLAGRLAGLNTDPSNTLHSELTDLAERQSPFPLLWACSPPEKRTFRLSKRTLSSSALKAYGECERRYFYARVLRLPEPPSLAMKLGSWFHQTMGELAAARPSQRELYENASAEAIRGIIDRVLASREGPAENSRIEQAIRFHLTQMVRRCLEADANRTDDYAVQGIEATVEFEHRGYAFGGRIDRLDRSRNGRPVVIDYKTGALPKLAKTLRSYILESADHPDRRDWQVPLYAAAVSNSGRDLPLAFIYYGIQPGEDPLLLALFIGPTGADGELEALLSPVDKKRHGLLLTDELNSCLDEAAALAERIFASRTGFEKTTELSRCGGCPFRPICGQGEKWN